MKKTNIIGIITIIIILLIPTVLANVNESSITNPTEDAIISSPTLNITWNDAGLNNATTYLNYYNLSIYLAGTKIKEFNTEATITEIGSDTSQIVSDGNTYLFKNTTINKLIEYSNESYGWGDNGKTAQARQKWIYYDNTSTEINTTSFTGTSHTQFNYINPYTGKRVERIETYIHTISTSGSIYLYDTTIKSYQKSNQLNYYLDFEDEDIITDGDYTLRLTTNTNFESEYTETNFTFYSNPLILNFFNYSNVADITAGKISDENLGTTVFFDNKTTIYQTNLTTGKISTQFNGINATLSNYTQYYEYENNKQQANISLWLLEEADDCIYYKVMETTNTPVSEAIVQVYQSKRLYFPTLTYGGWKLIGQRLTAEDGTTKFFIDSNKDTKVIVIKTKNAVTYNQTLPTMYTNEENCDSTNPIQIWMENANSIYDQDAYLVMSTSETSTKSGNFYGNMLAKSTTSARIESIYRNQTKTPNYKGEYTFTINENDYNISDNNNITIDVYLDGKLRFNDVTIVYSPIIDLTTNTTYVPTNVLEPDETTKAGIKPYLPIILLLLLIILTIGVQITVKGTDSGYYTYLIGLGIIGIITGGWGYLVLIIVLISTIGRGIIKKTVNE